MTTDELIARYIVADAHRVGPAEARISEFGVPVWAIVGYLQATGHSARAAADAYEIPEEAVVAALAYYDRHKISMLT